MSEARKLQTHVQSQDDQDLREVRRLLFSEYTDIIEELSSEIENLEKMISEMDLSSEKVRGSYHKSWSERLNNIPGWVLGSSFGLFLSNNRFVASLSKSKITTFMNIPFIMLVVLMSVMLLNQYKIKSVQEKRADYVLSELLNDVRKQGAMIVSVRQKNGVHEVSGVKLRNIDTDWLTVRFKVLTGKNLIMNWVPLHQIQGASTVKSNALPVPPKKAVKPTTEKLSLKDDIPDTVISTQGVDGTLKISGVAPQEWVEKVISKKVYRGEADISQLQTTEQVFEGSFAGFPMFMGDIKEIGSKSNIAMKALENYLQSSPDNKAVRIKVQVYNKNKKDFAVGRLIYNEFLYLVNQEIDKSQIKKATFTFVNRGFDEWEESVNSSKPFVVLGVRR